ncbi:MAG: hypothetical protein KUA43_09770 [Hoeflea sp.]|uniref:hypothetical protein n=1 Tax=Hoeflea sp. TaxID=1940281 RepID=UPI001E0E146A|nr:hypothetical protein [Hoeflea sp.]MBU4528463.1 hypothetical protein [Alphaproteobacteria bacterium]MBU4543132.1 hypothetical protein [Alphaproteobacteria bacterium]MBU4551823.1 hypothetical protein [Alphaproteobacteria bacterium]MBV1723718.1 hypothetical protein [Hoeflea sp.]MBV1762034.1 hypothetical protein [Hoeflea sp.]
MALDKRQILWFGSIALVAIVGFFLVRIVFEPSETDARAFLYKLLRADGQVHALGADGVVIPLAAAQVSRIDAAQCLPDRADVGHRGRYELRVARRFICRYAVVTPEAARFGTVLRATREPPGGPAESAAPGSLVDPSRYRVGSFRLSPVGRSEAEGLLGSGLMGE